MKGLKKYLVEDGTGGWVLDYNLSEKISDKKFREIHIEQNKIEIDNFQKLIGHKMSCEYCKEQIEKPEDLVRNAGGNSHVWCFEPIYIDNLKNKFPEHMRKYLDRVIKILG